MQRPKQYFGITGFMNSDDVSSVMRSYTHHHYLIMIGVLASSKTIRGIPNKFPRRYPYLHQIPQLLMPFRGALNLLHFNTKEPENLLEDLEYVSKKAGPNLDGFQLNLVWPDQATVKKWKDKSGHKIVLQVGEKAMEKADRIPQWIGRGVKSYEGAVDYVLIDPSGGLGIPFDPQFAINCLDELYSANLPGMNFGIAGGLSGENLEDLLGPVLERFPEACWDVEGKVRTPADDLDMEKVHAYCESSLRLLGRVKNNVYV